MQTNQKRKFNKFSNKNQQKFDKANGVASGFNNQSQRNIGKIFKAPKVKLGETFSLKINALGPKKMGLVELNNGLTVLVPFPEGNANLGDLVKVKLEKILPTKKLQKIKKTVILGSLVQVIQSSGTEVTSTKGSLEVGKTLNLTIKRKGPKNSGLAFWNAGASSNSENDFAIIVPNAKVGETVEVKITKIKPKYAFGSLVKFNLGPSAALANDQKNTLEKTKAFLSNIETSNKKNKFYHVVLPLTALNYSNFFAFKLNGNLLFVKKSLGIELGDHILIKLLRIREKFSIAKVVRVLQKTSNDKVLVFNTLKKNLSFSGTNSSKDKLERVARTLPEQQKKVKVLLKKMVRSSMHYGERALRCNANMRSYIWLRKKGRNKNRPLLKRGRHMINLFKTYKSLRKALLQLSKYAANGQTFLFVGTKKSASSLIAKTAVLSKTSFFVNSRWLGGMLTNWKTILKSISQIKPILKEKQKVIQNLLSSRQRIKDRLLSKVNSLRKKSKKLMVKGKKFILQLQQNPTDFIEKNQRILKEKNLILIQTKNYIEKYSAISLKEQQILKIMNSLKTELTVLKDQKNYLKNQIENSKKELFEIKQLFEMAQELAKFKNSLLASKKQVWSISFEKFNNLSASGFAGKTTKVVPNPPVEILNQIISIYSKKLNFGSSEVSQLNQPKAKQNEPIIFSKLLDKFLAYLPFMKKYLVLSSNRLAMKETHLKQLNNKLGEIVKQYTNLQNKALTYKKALETLKAKLQSQQTVLRALKNVLVKFSSEQRLFKFLPKLRYLPTTKTKMYQRVELLMKKFVDPKMSYVIDQIYDQKLKSTSKKMAAARKQKWQRLEKYFGGVTQMSKIRKTQISNNVAIIIGQQEEMNAVRECKKLGIKMFTVVDTNCNPKLSDHIIPANDDSGTSIEYILGHMLTHIRLAQKLKRKISFVRGTNP
jgi:small subunit ribosomal protein S2